MIVGDSATRESFVTGDAVNVASRLQAAAAPMEILVGESTRQLLRDAAELEPLEPMDAKGKTRPLLAFRLRSVRPAAETQRAAAESPFVGRARELRRMRQAFDDAVDERRAELFTLLGTAGVGKSRLVAEFVAGLPPDALVLRGRCLPYGQGITYWPVGEVVRMAAGIVDADTAEDARAAIRRLLEGGDRADAERAQRLVAAALGLSDEAATPEDIAWGVRHVFERLSASRPLVVVFEDIHWAEPTFLDAIEHVVDVSRGYPILLLCPARPELMEVRATWGGGKLNATTMLLEPLPLADADVLIDAQPGASALPDELRSRIAAAAEGNPLFVEEMLAMLVDDGVLALEDGRWVARRSVADVAVPPGIRVLLAARLDALVPDERAIAMRAAVAGRVFERDAAVVLAPEGLRAAVPGKLMALVRKELLRPERGSLSAGEAFKFRHVLIRDAAYESLPKSERGELHERFADWLEEVAADRLTEFEEIVGYHLEQAHDYRVELGLRDEKTSGLAARGGRHLGEAGWRASRRQDLAAAVSLLQRALRLVDPVTADAARYQLSLGDAHGKGHDLASADAALRSAATNPAAPPLLRAEAALMLLFNSAWRGEITADAMRRKSAAILWSVRRERPRDLRAWVFSNAGSLARDEGDVEAADRCLAVAYRLAQRSEDPDLQAEIGFQLVSHQIRSPTPVPQAIELAERLLALPTSRSAERALGMVALAVLLAMAGRADEGRNVHARAGVLRQRIGTSTSSVHRGILESYADHAEAARFLQLAAEESQAGDHTNIAWLHGRLARELAHVGRHDEALALVEAALAAEPGNTWLDCFGGGLRARLLAGRGRLQEALEVAQGAVRRARARHLDRLPYVFGAAVEDLGYVYEQAERFDDARVTYAEALDLYERKGIVPFVERVRESLTALDARRMDVVSE